MMSKSLDELKKLGSLESWSKYKIVAHNPLADETALLQKLGMSPDQCTSVSIYWSFNNKLILLDIECYRGAAWVTFTRSSDEDRYQLTFLVLTGVYPITTVVVEAILDNLSGWLERNWDEIPSKYQVNESKRISLADIAIEKLDTSAWQ